MIRVKLQISNRGNIIGEYFFDGDGKRVKKLVPSTGETTIFHYDAGNQRRRRDRY